MKKTRFYFTETEWHYVIYSLNALKTKLHSEGRYADTIGTNFILSEENVDVRYVISPNQTVAIEWNKVTNRSFTNILKKFSAQRLKISQSSITLSIWV